MQTHTDYLAAVRAFDAATDVPPHLMPSKEEYDRLLCHADAAFNLFRADIPQTAGEAAIKLREAAEAVDGGPFLQGSRLAAEIRATADALEADGASPSLIHRIRRLLALCDRSGAAHYAMHGYSDAESVRQFLSTTLDGLTRPRVVH